MARPSLTSALARLAEVRTERDRIATARRQVIIRDDDEQAWQLADLEADRRAVEWEIRRARSVVEFLRIGRPVRRAG